MQAEANAEKACWTPRRRELREWLRRNAPSLAELYEGAVSLLFDVPIPGYTRFVAHAVREIRRPQSAAPLAMGSSSDTGDPGSPRWVYGRNYPTHRL
jgi:hypothetical protein